MPNIRQTNIPFNHTPLGNWAEQQHRKRYDRAALKLANRTGMSLPVAQVYAEQNGLGRQI